MPATATLSSGVLTVDYAYSDLTLEAVFFTNDGTNIVLSGNVSGAISNPVGSVNKIVIQDGGASSNQTVTFNGQSPYMLSDGLVCVDIETVVVNASLNASGASAISVNAPKTIQLGVGANLATNGGDITLIANQQTSATTVSYHGIDVNGATIASTTGSITMFGRGSAGTGTLGRGIYVHAGAAIGGGTHGKVNLQGIGSAKGNSAYGVSLDSGSIATSGGTINLNGQGGAGNADETGVSVGGTNSQLVSGGGAISIFGQGGGGSGGATGTLINALISSGVGVITLEGAGGQSGGGLDLSGTVFSTSNITLIGKPGPSNIGGSVAIGNLKAIGSGSIYVTGTAGTNGDGTGVIWYGNVDLTAPGASISMTGKGGGFLSPGVKGINGFISTVDGSVNIVGYGGTGNYSPGVQIDGFNNPCGIKVGGKGSISILGIALCVTGSLSNDGVQTTDSSITTSAGNISITGTGGNQSSGVDLFRGQVIAGGTGNLTIRAFAGPGGGNFPSIDGALCKTPLSAGGAVSITGVAGNSSSLGVNIDNNCSSGGNANVTIIADSLYLSSSSITAGASGKAAIILQPYSAGTKIDIGGKDVTNAVPMTLGLNSLDLDSLNAGTIQIGDATTGPIAVTSSWMRTTKTNIVLTSASSISVTNTLVSAGGDISLNAGGPITATKSVIAGIGNLTLNAPGQTATFSFTGNQAAQLVIPADVTCLVNGSFDSTGFVQVNGTLGGSGSVGTVTVTSTGKIIPGNSPGKLSTRNIVFNSTSKFAVELNGPNVGTGYDQLAITGSIDLGGATLQASLGFATAYTGEVFTIINNDGTDSVIGTFAGYAEGATATLGSIDFAISYHGGDGNDVTLTAITALPPVVTSAVFGDGTNQRSQVRQIVVNFSEPVNFSGSVAAAFQLHRSAASKSTGLIADVDLQTNPVNGPASSVTVTFTGQLSDSGGSLVDGVYDFTIDALQITGSGGNLNGGTGAGSNYTVVGSAANKFFRLFGDSTGDGNVKQDDHTAFAQAYLNGPSTVFDFDSDGQVGQLDFNAFRLRFLSVP